MDCTIQIKHPEITLDTFWISQKLQKKGFKNFDATFTSSLCEM
jgi:hypothetical protein